MSERKLVSLWMQTLSWTPWCGNPWRQQQILNHWEPLTGWEEGSPSQHLLFNTVSFLQLTPFPPGRWAHSTYSCPWLHAVCWSGFEMWSASAKNSCYTEATLSVLLLLECPSHNYDLIVLQSFRLTYSSITSSFSVGRFYSNCLVNVSPTGQGRSLLVFVYKSYIPAWQCNSTHGSQKVTPAFLPCTLCNSTCFHLKQHWCIHISLTANYFRMFQISIFFLPWGWIPFLFTEWFCRYCR